MTSTPRLTPEEIANRGFASAFRGVSETEVRNFLRRVSDEYGAARERERDLTQRVADLEERLRRPPPLDEQQLLDALGEETTRVLRSAQEAAHDIRTRAEERSSVLLRDAQEEARALREGAEEQAARQTSETEAAVAERERESLERADATRSDAERSAAATIERAAAEAAAMLEQAKESGRGLVEDARAARERVLGDLARRRALLQAQLDELRGGRERLLEAYRVVKETLADATAALAAVQAKAHSEGSITIEPIPEIEIDIALDEPRDLDLVPEVDRPRSADRPREVDGLGGRPPASAGGADPGTPRGPLVAVSDVPPSNAGVVDQLFARLKSSHSEAAPAEADDTGRADGGATEVTDTPDVTDVTDAADVTHTAAGQGAQAPGSRSAPSATDLAVLAERDRAVGRVFVALGRQAKRALQDEQNELLDALRTQRGRPGADAVLPPFETTSERWADVLSSAVDEVYLAATDLVAPGTASDAAPRQLVLDLAKGVFLPPRERLAQAIDGSDDGGTDGPDDADDTDDTDLAARVGARYREWRGQGLDAALADALVAAWARGTLDAAAADAALRWVPPAGGCCPDCDDDALEPTRRGEPFPTGQTAPPAHPGCRCVLAIESVGPASPTHAGATSGSA